MVLISTPPPVLSTDTISLWRVTDELLGQSPIVIFYGPSHTPTAVATANNSRIQAHVFSPVGFVSYPRLTISPSSPLYSAVNCLPREEQGDEISRALAFSLFKYFSELPQHVKDEWQNNSHKVAKLPAAPTLFSEAHASMLASRMEQVQNVPDVIRDVRQGLAEQSISWIDVDVVLPQGAIRDDLATQRESGASDCDGDSLASMRYGKYAEVINLFGQATFLPTSRLRRAPSRPTGLNKTMVFTRRQKESIRRELCELLDTEESYVSKLDDLVNNVAADFRHKARNKGPSSSSPGEEALKALFPESLDQILQANTGFLDDLRRVVEDTENDAIRDIESTDDAAVQPVSGRADLTGTVALASCLRSWLPRFSHLYVDYMQAHSHFSNFVRILMKETGSSFSSRLVETGEQRLMCMLIEPVQRLPRYNLYIDNIIKQLPAKHSALKPLLKARDVVSDICSQDCSHVPPSKLVERLRALVPSLASSVRITGRLITAVDVSELPAPYHTHAAAPRVSWGVLLIFTDYLVLLNKLSKSSITARGLIAQLDGQDASNSRPDELTFRQAYELDSFDATEMDSMKLIQLIPHYCVPARPSCRPSPMKANDRVQVFHLGGAYEDKANKFMEDLVRARVEGRYPDDERQSLKFDVRSATVADLTFFSAVTDKSTWGTDGRGESAKVRVLIATENSTVPPSIAPGLDVLAVIHVCDVNAADGAQYRLETSTAVGLDFTDMLTTSTFLPVLAKRCGDALRSKNQLKNIAITQTLLFKNLQILTSLNLLTDNAAGNEQAARSRPHSPVKMLSNLFGGMHKDNVLNRRHHTNLSLTDIPQLPRPGSSRRRSDDAITQSAVGSNVTHAASDALGKLEDTLASYVLALQARQGNIVGKVLRSRHNAPPLDVNQVYNSLNENAANHELTAQVSVDVLFCAFESFVKFAWQDKMGPIISKQTWNDIQAKMDISFDQFDHTFRLRFAEMSRQNQRALKAIVKLLAELLQGASNDGDRGIMTASFAEILVLDGNPYHFVPILDYLVTDFDQILSEHPLGDPNPQSQPGSLTSESRHRSTNTGSLTSNTSSFRRKFGLLSRKGSRNQHDNSEPEGISVWRTLSKTKQGPDSQSSSLSKSSSMSRAGKPVDLTNALKLSPKRPVSRDRPTVLGAFPHENLRPLSTIGEAVSSGRPRKKRRSSLSDLTTLRDSAPSTPAFASPRSPAGPGPCPAIMSSPKTPCAVKQSFIPQPSLASKIMPSSASPTRKENSPIRTLPRAFSPNKTRPALGRTEDAPPVSQSSTPGRRLAASSGIPTLKSAGGLSERPTSGNIRKLPPTPDKHGTPDKPAPLNLANGKLRMQAPDKLRRRLQAEHQAISEANGMQAELSAISAELQSTSMPKRPVNHSKAHSTSTVVMPLDAGGVEAKIAQLSSKHAAEITTLKKRLDSLSTDMMESLEVSEKRNRNLDKDLNEAKHEMDVMYSTINERMSLILDQVKAGHGIQELRLRASRAEEETAKVKKENWRLKREIAGLRAQLRD